ncbi:MAG: hypothetical protein KDH94_04400 [Coxiellaceae bacterium]|nr:hypothetical protein [Coxiellaceae bacterium]
MNRLTYIVALSAFLVTGPALATTQAQKHVVGYFENWSQYRPNGGKFLPSQINAKLFTDVDYAFAYFGFVDRSLDPSNPHLTGDFKIQPVEWNDQSKLYPAFQALKKQNPNLKTFYSIGGWAFNDPNDPNGAGEYTYRLFSQMASTASGREAFIQSAIQYAHQYGFNGIDIDWEYPGDSARGGTEADMENYTVLLKEFRAAINADAKQHSGEHLLLTIAVPAIPKGPANYINNPSQYFAWQAKNAQYVDWLNLMTYDYHGAFSATTGVNSPMQGDPKQEDIADTVQHYLAGGVPANKIVLGMPSYGHSFAGVNCANAQDCAPGKSFTGAGSAGPATGQPGLLAYYEINKMIQSGTLTQGYDYRSQTPYAYSPITKEWVSYDDPNSIAIKAQYVLSQNLGGAMVWAIDMDEFNNGYPIMTAINKTLGR